MSVQYRVSPFVFRYAIQASPLRIAHIACSLVILSKWFVNGMPAGKSRSVSVEVGISIGMISATFVFEILEPVVNRSTLYSDAFFYFVW